MCVSTMSPSRTEVVLNGAGGDPLGVTPGEFPFSFPFPSVRSELSLSVLSASLHSFNIEDVSILVVVTTVVVVVAVEDEFVLVEVVVVVVFAGTNDGEDNTLMAEGPRFFLGTSTQVFSSPD